MLKDRWNKIAIALLLTAIQIIYVNAFYLQSFAAIITTTIFYFIIYNLVVNGSTTLITKIRNQAFNSPVPLKVLFFILFIFLYSVSILSVSNLLWQNAWLNNFVPIWVPAHVLYLSCFVILFALVYEILLLYKEKEIDNKVIKHLDSELLNAEVNTLKNELDPHFVYNSLMPLYYLIKNDVSKAELFSKRLMQVYQHFLQNRNKDFITLHEEILFIKNYYYLLQIRFKNSLVLKLEVDPEASSSLVIPFTLQLLLENAIKHNHLSPENPLEISFKIEQSYLVISNRYNPLDESYGSTKIGLHNLRTRYKILMKRNIYVFKNKEHFTVKVPLKKKVVNVDKENFKRG